MEERTKALLVGVNLNNDPEFETALKELESLAEACNMEVVGVETQNVSQINIRCLCRNRTCGGD